VISHIISHGDVEEVDEYEGVVLFSQRGFLFLFPPKEKWGFPGGEIVFCTLLSFAFGFLMSGLFLDLAEVFVYVGYNHSTGAVVLGYIVVSLSSYSLFSKSCPEGAVYMDNDQEIGFRSNHYQRPLYCVCIGALRYIVPLSLNLAGARGEHRLAPAVLYLVNLTYLLQVLSLLSSPLVTLLWFMEQCNIHVFGSTARASDGRIALHFVFNAVAVGLGVMISFTSVDWYRMLVPILALISSHNIFGTCLIKKPFVPVNERLKSKKAYADIVFDNITIKPKKSPSTMTNLGAYVMQSLLILIAVIVIVVLRMGPETIPDGALEITALVLMLLNWGISASTRFALLRIIPSLHI